MHAGLGEDAQFVRHGSSADVLDLQQSARGGVQLDLQARRGDFDVKRGPLRRVGSQHHGHVAEGLSPAEVDDAGHVVGRDGDLAAV